MLERVFLHLLILCGILCHGIIATLSDGDTRESSDFLVRKRRVINYKPGGLNPINIEDANYMVNIRQFGNDHCAGAILTQHTVITAARCVKLSVSQYKVVHGTECEQNCSLHNVTSKIVHYGNFPYKKYDGIALVRVIPPFTFSPRTGNIRLHAGILAAGTQVTVAGWGCIYPIRHVPFLRRRLRSITLPIMNHRSCQNIYGSRFFITDKYICTYDKDQYCARTDIGAPLVFNGKLVGIHIYKGEQEGLKNPDVFLDLQRNDYSEWIRENTLLM